MITSIIAAIGNNRIIGKNNKLPWALPADMKHFRKITFQKPIIMGQKTFESIGRALPDRINIILTLDKNFRAPNCFIAYSIEEAIQIAKNQSTEEVMICGGVSVYKQFLPLTDRIYLTLIRGDFEGDAYFPEFDYNNWNEVERLDNSPDAQNPYPYSFIILERKRKV